MAPFDQSQFEVEFAAPQVTLPVPDEVLRVLIEAREWLSDPKRWHKGTLFYPVYSGKERAESACAWGALKKAGDKDDAFEFINAICLKAFGCCLPSYNDASAGHADILALFDRAIAARKAQAPMKSGEAS